MSSYTTSILASVLILSGSVCPAQIAERPRLTLIEFTGAGDIGIRNIEQRLRAHGVLLRPGSPAPESRTLCEIKEVIGDMMAEKGFVDAAITHELATSPRNSGTATLTFTIKKGERSQRPNRVGKLLAPVERCSR